MYSRCLSAAVLCVVVSAGSALGQSRVLRVCADPNNLPFSNEAQEGFENRLAEIVAHDLHAQLEYTWWSQRRSFVKNSLAAGRCDVVLGIASSVDSVLATKPYYRSTYTFVSRKDRDLRISSLSDPRLSEWRIGIHMVGNDYAPPAYALARRGVSANLVGFSLFGGYGEPNPAARIVDAVAKGEVDVAIVWGPFAGFFAKHVPQALEVSPVSPTMFLSVPFTYDISMGVRKDDRELKAELDRVLDRECAAIDALLAGYGIPRAMEDKPRCDGSQQPVSASLR